MQLNAQRICQWAEQIDITNNGVSYSVVVDKNGNVYATGYFYEDTVTFNNGIKLISSGSYDGYIAKYNNEGSCQWAEKIAGSASDFVWSIAVDDYENVFVSGNFESQELYFNNGIMLNKIDTLQQDAYYAKYNSEGICQWAKIITGNGSVDVGGISVDNYGYIYIAGNFFCPILSINNNIELINSGCEDAFISKFDSDGICQWAKKIAGSGYDVLKKIILDKFSNIYVTGYFDSYELDFNNNITLDNNNNNNDGFIAKYNAEGICQWAEKFDGNNDDYAWNLALEENIIYECNNNSLNNSEPNIWVTGRFKSEVLNFNNGIALSNSGAEDAFFAKYSPRGVCLLADKIAGSSDDFTAGIMIDNNKNVYIAGDFSSPILYFNNDISLNNCGSENTSDIFLAKYDINGNCKWAELISGSLNDNAHGITIDEHSNIYIAGDFQSNLLNFNNGISITSNSTENNYNGYITKYSNESSIEDENSTKNSFSVFPNPVQSIATINCNFPNSDNFKLSITNLVGERVKEVALINTTNNQINLSDLSSGVYIFTISGNGFSESKIVSVIK
ncbi:MAG TPA: SBBP repeat-containing protein [Candidatus Kapabacteria bacterium]|nr:SBBP repeat-containing protein [Candidatus Kapabacteria bacterium]